ncbi:peroxidase-related enzyme [Ferrimicrobium acidiphilum]|uniref:peroxidase-related enzyme n=1 Tax=Ferrimicrobium acidiphilum TaxID=121039 RepID=UPI0023F17E4A|nr:peroxidase-related enzyme [Ferrimicrobium acidiphilum]
MTKVPFWFNTTEQAPNLDADIAERIEAVRERSGFLPNVFATLSYFPAEFRAFFTYHDALMEGDDSGLTKAEREMIVVSTSAANECTYCVVAHGAIYRIRSKHPYRSDQVAIDFERAELSEREKAILRFAHTVSLHPQTVTEESFAPLYDLGFSDEDIWQIGAIASFFALSNRLAGFARIMPNQEFYLMGRDRPLP